MRPIRVLLVVVAILAGCGVASRPPTLSVTDLQRIVSVRPTTPGWDWPTEPIVRDPTPSAAPDSTADTPGPTAFDPLTAELDRQIESAGGVVAADGSRWQDEEKLGVTLALLLSSDAGSHTVLTAQRAFQRGWVERTLGGGHFTDLPVDGVGDEAWRIQSDFPGGQEVTVGWRRASLMLQVHIQCIFRTCPSDIDLAARAWADAIDKEAAAASEKAIPTSP